MCSKNKFWKILLTLSFYCMVRAGPNWGEKTGKIGILKVKNAYNKPPHPLPVVAC